MNVFDFVVAVALGEMLAHTILSKEVTFHNSSFLHDSIRAQRVTEEEIRSAVRARIGFARSRACRILETDATFSVVWRHAEAPSPVSDVPGYSV